jgi:hypothetical protein
MNENEYLLTREMLEELEDKTLAPYAMKSKFTSVIGIA